MTIEREIHEMAAAMIRGKDQAQCDELCEAIQTALMAKKRRNVDVLVSLCGVLAAEISGRADLTPGDTEAFTQAVCLYLMACVRTGEAMRRAN